MLLNNGENLFNVSRRLGHASVAITTEVYAHVLEESDQKVADRFAQLMQEKKEKVEEKYVGQHFAHFANSRQNQTLKMVPRGRFVIRHFT